jgi:AcrR family transcriptional regulator
MKKDSFPRVSESTQQRREHIIQAATRIIAKDGLATLSVRSVADKAGCSRGLVEHYFRNKTSLLIAANDWANKVYLERVDAAVGTMSGLDALELRLRNLFPYNETIHDEWKVRIAFWHQGITIPSVEESNNRSFYSVYNAILADMRQAQSNGEIATNIPLQACSEMLMMTVIGLCTCCISGSQLREKTALDRRLTIILEFLKSGDVAALEAGKAASDL